MKLGVLYVIGTPIGNLGDLSFRAIDVLSSVDFIAAEDTRVSSRMLKKYSINKNYTFNVNAIYFFNNYKLKAEIKEVIAPSTFSIQLIDKGIFHNKNFILEPLNNKTKLIYNFNGKFGGGLKNTIISPIIKFSCINEIRYIKKAIESSEFYTNNEKINTVSSYK